ncbi:MAG: family N-acetyltransferase [Chitinophagaceae bacterium]|nr:family N-acetyltransferase [Chitinophagaceae bacterium]
MTDILIREVHPDDGVAVNELSAQLGYPVSVSATAENIILILKNKDEMIFVAQLEDNVIGWIQISYLVRLESGPFFEIVGLVVDEKYRGKGIGKSLIAEAKIWCFKKGNYKLRVRSNTKRLSTHQFYLNLDFKEVKEQKIFETALIF